MKHGINSPARMYTWIFLAENEILMFSKKIGPALSRATCFSIFRELPLYSINYTALTHSLILQTPASLRDNAGSCKTSYLL